jgi:hypothetical protein
VAAAVLVLAAVAAALSGGGRSGPARVAVATGAPGRAVPPSFLGLSMEWTSVAPYGGPPRPGIVALLRRLGAAAGSPVPLRIGGASGEESWWDPAHRGPRPPGVRHDIDAATLDALAGLAGGAGGPVSIGLNLQSGDAGNALALARAARRRLGPRLDALEIGNEPDLYTAARTFGPPAVRRLRKHVRYAPADYLRDAGRYLDTLTAALPADARPRLVIGGFAGRKGWPATLPRLIARHPGTVGAIAAHRYGLSACALGADASDSRTRLLRTSASRDRMEALAPLVGIAHRNRLPLWVAEVNSAPCGGAPGASDTFTAAVWLTDALFTLLRIGADRADVQTFDRAVYAPFAVDGTAVRPRPPYWGMLAFARAAPRGARLVPVRVGGGQHIRSWATTDRDGTVRVAVIAGVDARSVPVRIATGIGRPCARVQTTSAPALAARAGVADRPPRTVCPRGRVLALAVPGPSLTVVTLPPRAG